MVWIAGLTGFLVVYQFSIERDVWYLLVFGILACIVLLGIFGAKHTERLKVALEYPFIYF